MEASKGSNLDDDTVGQRKSGEGKGWAAVRATDPVTSCMGGRDPEGLSSEMRSNSVVHLTSNDAEGEAQVPTKLPLMHLSEVKTLGCINQRFYF